MARKIRDAEEEEKKSPIALLIMLFVFIVILDISIFIYLNYKPINTTSYENFRVTDIISGDTIKLENNQIIKLIGIQAPLEGQSYYGQSKDFLKFSLLGKIVKLENDKQDKDSSGNLLRYVYVEFNNQLVFINLESIKQGYSIPMPSEPDTKYKADIQAAREQCVSSKLNLCS